MDNAGGTSLKELMASGEPVLVPGAPNALTARIIEDLGYQVVYVTGAGVTNTYLGAPDIGVISLTELADHVARIRDAVNIPIMVDADTGFGNALNTFRTVKVLERSGANAIQIEDQVYPKRCGHFDGKEVISKEEMVQKIRAAVDARGSDDVLIIARTDARAVLGFEAALERIQAYIEAGADIAFVEAPQTLDEIREIPRRVPVPHILNLVSGGRTPLISLEELKGLNYAFVLYANVALQAAVHGMQRVLKHLREKGEIEELAHMIAPFSERQRLVNKPYFDGLEAKYSV